jgi:dolichol-phosphate mannosyltransferase
MTSPEPNETRVTPDSQAPSAARAPGVAELALIIPTLNERDNVAPLLARLEAALAGVAWEVIFVDDDSTDGTRDAVRAIGLRDPRVRCIHRIGRRGLASACIEGALATSAPYLAVIDADLQHDETLLPRMLRTLESEPLDIVVGSRYVAGGGFGGWSMQRRRISGIATRLSRYILKADLADPMSGYFVIRRDAFERAVRRLSGIGFKILMDLFASSPEPLRFKELPYEFRERQHGESKLDTLVVWEYAMLIADKMVGHIVPVRFLSFAFVGGVGVFVQLAALLLLQQGFAVGFKPAQAAAIVVAMVGNFLLNNLLTYRDLRLRGWQLLVGLASFCLVCSVGAVANWGAATLLYDELEFPSWLASAAGAVVGAVWNFALSGVATWRKRGPA